MKIPEKYRKLYDIELKDLERPDYVFLTYSVCIIDNNACGWAGWIIEALFKKTEEVNPTGTGDKVLEADYSQKCPRCGKTLFRTAAKIKMSFTSIA